VCWPPAGTVTPGWPELDTSALRDATLQVVSATGTPYLSVVVELDNLLHGEVSRARTMFDRLLRQIREIEELQGRVEILAPYDAEELDAQSAQSIVRPFDAGDGPSVELVAARGLRYYQLKNEAGRRARGEIILFVDSDCLPEDGWLRRLLDSFLDPQVEVVAGNCYVDRDTFYAKTFALGWYFPPRLPDGALIAEYGGMVNTVAMWRHIFEKYPFPDYPSLYMTQGSIWAQTLKENGVRTFTNPGARVAHPPPCFLRSALVNGYDVAQRTRQPSESKLQGLRRSYWGFRENLRDAFRRIRDGHREIGLSRAAVPVALALAGAYWTVWALAEALTRWSPRLIPHKYLR
jgi:Glycosyl transferase family 2